MWKVFLYWSTDWWVKETGTSNRGRIWPRSRRLTRISTETVRSFTRGRKGRCPPFRLECVRDGIEDFEYLKMAEERLGRDFVDDIIGR